MDMWCPYGIRRECWDKGIPMLIDPDPSPLKGVVSLAGVLPFASVSGSSPMRVVVVVVVVVGGGVVVVGGGVVVAAAAADDDDAFSRR